jgi:Hemerythrin HHE cation binding domain
MADSAVDVLAREHRDLRELFARVRDQDADRAAAWLDVVKHVATHVAVERTFVYPLVKRRRLGSPDLADDLRHDYSQMEHLLVLTERRKINSPDMPDLVTRVLDVFEAHEARCAALLMPTLTEKLSPAELEELGTKMRGAENVIVSHPHPHLLALGPIYQWTTRLAARWDRVRDRTVRNR